MSLERADKLLWWGYLHTNGSIQLKRWWGDWQDIQDAIESPFADQIFTPFEAGSREEAIKIIERKMNNV